MKRLKNSEDRHISPKGTRTRVMAKNLMVGDKFVLSGDKVGKVVGVNVKVVAGMGQGAASIRVRRGNGKEFVRKTDMADRIWIVETPETRFARRAQSRIPLWDRSGIKYV